jgi:hypothetical protein
MVAVPNRSIPHLSQVIIHTEINSHIPDNQNQLNLALQIMLFTVNITAGLVLAMR